MVALGGLESGVTDERASEGGLESDKSENLKLFFFEKEEEATRHFGRKEKLSLG